MVCTWIFRDSELFRQVLAQFKLLPIILGTLCDWSIFNSFEAWFLAATAMENHRAWSSIYLCLLLRTGWAETACYRVVAQTSTTLLLFIWSSEKEATIRVAMLSFQWGTMLSRFLQVSSLVGLLIGVLVIMFLVASPIVGGALVVVVILVRPFIILAASVMVLVFIVKIFLDTFWVQVYRYTATNGLVSLKHKDIRDEACFDALGLFVDIHLTK